MTEGHIIWEWFSDNTFALLMVAGSILVLAYVYIQRRRADGYYNREKRK